MDNNSMTLLRIRFIDQFLKKGGGSLEQMISFVNHKLDEAGYKPIKDRLINYALKDLRSGNFIHSLSDKINTKKNNSGYIYFVTSDILNAVNDQGYELQENYKRLFKSRVNSNDQKLLKEAYFPVHGADSPDVKKAKAALANWFMNISRHPATPAGSRDGTLSKRTLDILHDLIDDYALAYAEDELAAADKIMSRKL